MRSSSDTCKSFWLDKNFLLFRFYYFHSISLFHIIFICIWCDDEKGYTVGLWCWWQDGWIWESEWKDFMLKKKKQFVSNIMFFISFCFRHLTGNEMNSSPCTRERKNFKSVLYGRLRREGYSEEYEERMCYWHPNHRVLSPFTYA